MENKEMLIHSPIIYTKENIGLLRQIPVLEDERLYVYVMLSSNGNVKIGKTTNIVQRLKSLSGSNGGGSKITKLYCSPPTYLYSIEGTCHNHYHYARIPGTEWFDGCKVDFNDVVKYVDGLFNSKSFETCNELRRKFIEKEKKKVSKRNQDDNEGN
jgi:hypothetical protein